MSNVIQFPQRHIQRVIVRPLGDWQPAWLVTFGDNGWAHGDKDSALRDGEWLARNTGLAIQVLATGSA